jgi:hypothetical protein
MHGTTIKNCIIVFILEHLDIAKYTVILHVTDFIDSLWEIIAWFRTGSNGQSKEQNNKLSEFIPVWSLIKA